MKNKQNDLIHSTMRTSKAFDGIVVFDEPYYAIKACKLLQSASIDCNATSSPPKYRKGCCALGVEIYLFQKNDIEQVLSSHDVVFLQIVPKK